MLDDQDRSVPGTYISCHVAQPSIHHVHDWRLSR